MAPLPAPTAALVGLAALAVVLVPFLWPLADQLDTMAHEGAHAVVAAAVGRTVVGVTLDQDSNGATYILEFAAGPGELLISFAGYLGPSAFGLWAAKLIETGHVVTVLWIAVILLALLLSLIRPSFGLVSVPAAIAILALAMHAAHRGPEEVLAYGIAWLLLLSGARTAVTHGANAGDAVTLSLMTRLPRRLWSLLWIAATFLAVIVGGKWLVLRS